MRLGATPALLGSATVCEAAAAAGCTGTSGIKPGQAAAQQSSLYQTAAQHQAMSEADCRLAVHTITTSASQVAAAMAGHGLRGLFAV